MHESEPNGNASDELDPDEPRTPLWLPLVGLGLFLAALMYLLVADGDESAVEGEPSGEEQPAGEE